MKNFNIKTTDASNESDDDTKFQVFKYQVPKIP